MRSSVPVVLSENLREKLEHCRPALERPAAGGFAEANAAQEAAECKEAALSPAPAELQGSFANAMLKMPTLRSAPQEPRSICIMSVGCSCTRTPTKPAAVQHMTLAQSVRSAMRQHGGMTVFRYRAKLEDALERLQRVMSAVAADAGQALPNTVERAARGLATPGGVPAPAAAAAVEGTPSPKLAEALSAGKIATRRRVASNLRPVPYPKQY